MRRTSIFYRRESGLPFNFPRGHFHSPLPDILEGQQLAATASQRPAVDGVAGIDLRVDAQRELLSKIADLYSDFDWSERSMPGRRFNLAQSWYKEGDSICLYSMLRLFRPRRVVEIGSGFSSALILDTDDRFLGRQTELTFIEPNPDRLDSLLFPEDASRVRVIRQRVQMVPAEVFSEMQSGDFLFIDSSHVSKIGSDVNYLILDVLPRVSVGTYVHFHDIFWPFEYPAGWIERGIAWNESYLLRAFLIANGSFEVVFWVPFAARMWPELIRNRMPKYLINTGASLWIRRVR
jgi:predicted O-methyltransferase YrrM